MIRQEDQWDLRRLINELGPTDSQSHVYIRRAGLEYFPSYFHSWRGSYTELSIAYSSIRQSTPVRCIDLYRSATDSVGRAYEGWKGGQYTMSYDSLVFVDHDGDSEGYGFYKLIQLGIDYVLLTDKVEGWAD